MAQMLTIILKFEISSLQDLVIDSIIPEVKTEKHRQTFRNPLPV